MRPWNTVKGPNLVQQEQAEYMHTLEWFYFKNASMGVFTSPHKPPLGTFLYAMNVLGMFSDISRNKALFLVL